MSDGTFDYLNDGASYSDSTDWQPPKPEVQTEAANQVKSVVATSYPVINDVADWFEQQINNCDNIHNIQVASTTINGVKYTREIHVEAQVLAYQMLKDLLLEKARDWEGFGSDNE